jgi:hypothetical protein
MSDNPCLAYAVIVTAPAVLLVFWTHKADHQPVPGIAAKLLPKIIKTKIKLMPNANENFFIIDPPKWLSLFMLLLYHHYGFFPIVCLDYFV